MFRGIQNFHFSFHGIVTLRFEYACFFYFSFRIPNIYFKYLKCGKYSKKFIYTKSYSLGIVICEKLIWELESPPPIHQIINPPPPLKSRSLDFYVLNPPLIQIFFLNVFFRKKITKKNLFFFNFLKKKN